MRSKCATSARPVCDEAGGLLVDDALEAAPLAGSMARGSARISAVERSAVISVSIACMATASTGSCASRSESASASASAAR